MLKIDEEYMLVEGIGIGERAERLLVIAIIGMIAIVRRGMAGDDEDDFDEDADYTEEFLDDDELDEAIDEAFDDDEDED